MAKVMLVEDDNNLREIYEARLQAEGYDIVTAHDGEEALVVGKAENPDLIISDVMMPKISGFEMLDILRNTDGLKDVKVIMLTALGQSDDQQRADRLGADAYLVKSQVTLEDIVKVADRLLNGDSSEAAAAPEATVAPETAVAEPVAAPAPEPVATVPAPEPIPVAAAPADPVSPVAPVADPPQIDAPVAAVSEEPSTPVVETPVAVTPETVSPPVPETVPTPPVQEPLVAASEPVVAVPEAPLPTAVTPEAPALPAEPTSELPAPSPVPLPDTVSSSEESASVQAQIDQFAAENIPTPQEVEPTETANAEVMPQEQFLTTAPPDLTSTAPVAEATAESNDDILNTALENLTGLPSVPAVAGEPATEAVTAVAPGNNAELKGGGRVIQPLESTPKPDLNALMSIEEAKEQATGTTISPVPGAAPIVTTMPATPPAVGPATSTAAPAPNTQLPGQSVDPNSIAL